MTWSALVLVWGMTLLLGGTLLLTPVLARPTLPLGVRIPADRTDDPVVRGALRRYRGAVLGVTGVGLAAGTALVPAAPPAAVVLAVLLVTVGGLAAFVLARRSVLAAKREQAWYAGKAVRMTAAVAEEPDGVPVPMGWYLASGAVLAVTTVIGLVRYPDLPDPVPMHWDLSGTPDSFAAKTPWSALAGVWIGWAVLALLVVLAHVATRSPARVHPGDPVELAVRRAQVHQRVGQRVLGTTALLVTVLVCALGVAGWADPEDLGLAVPAFLVFLALFAAVTVDAVLLYRREMRGADRPGDRPAAEAVDDDRHWRGGLLYVNRDDPSVWVPKRVGIGWTVNLGSPGGIALTAALVGVLLLGLALPWLLG